MATIVTRSGKGSSLTNNEVDANFTNLNTAKLELGGGTITGTVVFNSAPTFNTAITMGSSLNVASSIGISGNTVIDASRNIIATSLDISGNIDVDGVTNLDATNVVGQLAVTGGISSTTRTNINLAADVGVLSATTLENGSALGLSITVPTSNIAAGDGVGIALGIVGRGRSYIANKNTSTNADASNLSFWTENGGVIGERFVIDSSGAATFNSSVASDTFLNASGNLNILSTQSVLIKFDSDNNQTNREFNIQSNNSTQLFKIDENGAMTHSGTASFAGVITANAGLTVGNSNIGSNSSQLANLTINNNGYIGSVNNSLALRIMTSGSVVLNEAGGDVDFRVESKDNANALFVNGDTNNVGINSTATNARLEVVATSGEVFRADSNGGAYRLVVNQTGVNLNGLVGIGTTNPVAQFAVGGAGRRIEFDGGSVIRGFDRSASWAGIDFEASAYTFDVSTVRMMDITSSGVIINSASSAGANGKLQITGGIGLTGNSEIRNSTNADDGSTLKFFGTQFVAGPSNSNSYDYSGGGLVASVSPSNATITLDAGAVNTSGHRLKVINAGNGVAGSLQYLSGTTPRFHVDSATGSVGIGVADGDVTNDNTAARTYVGIIGTGNRGRLNLGSTAANGADGGVVSFVNGANELGAIYMDSASGSQTVGTMFATSTGLIDIRGAGGVVINNNGVDADFRIASNNNDNMFFINGDVDKIGMGRSANLRDVVTITGANSDTGFGTTSAALEITNSDNSVGHFSALNFRVAAGNFAESLATVSAKYTNYSGNVLGQLSFGTRGAGTTNVSERMRIDEHGGIFLKTVGGATAAVLGGANIINGLNTLPNAAGTPFVVARDSGTTRSAEFGGGVKVGLNLTLADGNLVVANGHGVDFSATAGSGTSELLDDYEEGTWTPASIAGISLTVNAAVYTKIGRVVHIGMAVTFASNTNSAAVQFSGLPFPVRNQNDQAYGATIANTDVGRDDVFFPFLRGTSNIGIGNSSNADIANSVYSGKKVCLSGFYFTDA